MIVLKRFFPRNTRDAVPMAILFGGIGYFIAWIIGMAIINGLTPTQALTVAGHALWGAKLLKDPEWFNALVFVFSAAGALSGLYLTSLINELDERISRPKPKLPNKTSGTPVLREGKPTLTLFDFTKEF